MTTHNVIVLVGSGASIGSVSLDPLVGGPRMAELWEAIGGVENFEQVKSLVKYTTGNNIEDFLSQCHNALNFVAKTDRSIISGFILESEKIIYEKCTHFLNGSPTLPNHEKFLDKLAKRKNKAPRPKIFTTNYDLCLEIAAAKKGLTIIDGFSYSQPRFFNPNFFDYDIIRRARSQNESNELVDGVLQLYKIHGSVDWEINDNGIQQTSDPAENKRCLIYPASTKYQHSYAPPYLELMAKYLTCIREPNTALITIGFGFNDDHLSAPILSAINSNPSLNVLVVDPYIQDAFENEAPSANKTQKVLKTVTDSKVTLLNASFAEFVDLIPNLSALSWEQQLGKSLSAIR